MSNSKEVKVGYGEVEIIPGLVHGCEGKKGKKAIERFKKGLTSKIIHLTKKKQGVSNFIIIPKRFHSDWQSFVFPKLYKLYK